MKKTRNLFVLLKGKEDSQTVLDELRFKGLVSFNSPNVSLQDINNVFKNNKSAVCICSPPSDFTEQFIPITITNSTEEFLENVDCINLRLGDIAGQFQKIANNHNCDIGDHYSNSSGLNGIPSIKDCGYCNYIVNCENDYWQRTVYSNENFFVIPTIGQFILGYLLIIPYKHIMSNAELTEAEMKDFMQVLEDVKYILELTYQTSNILVWENGTGNSGRGKAKDSVVHAHTHVAPSLLTADKIEAYSTFPLKEISTEEICNYNKHSYLLVQDIGNKWRINDNPDVYIPRQYVRQLLADEYHIPGECWNWRTHQFLDMMMQTCNDISTALQDNWKTLPDRIKQATQDYLYGCEK